MKYANAAFLIFALLVPNFAWARKPAARKADAPCARCADIRKLESEFLALKYEEPKERSKGRQQLVRVLAQLERFHTNKRSASRKEEFRALVNLVAAALPYDTGTEGAESIVALISESRELKAIYNDASASLTDSCRQQFLRTVVDERMCLSDLEERGATEQREDACIRSPVFRYEHCIGMKTED